MTNLVVRDNFVQDLLDFRRNFDQVFNRFLSSPLSHQESWLAAGFTAPVESFIDKDDRKFHCRIMVPGVDAKEISIQIQANTLMISGERSDARQTDNQEFFHHEITYGAFQRSLTLPVGVDGEKLIAEYRDGVLEIVAPVASNALPKKIDIKTLPSVRHATA
jgi:HSP20 family protein